MRKRSENPFDAAPAVAGNGLIDRRALLGRGVAFAGAIGTGVGPYQRIPNGCLGSLTRANTALSR